MDGTRVERRRPPGPRDRNTEPLPIADEHTRLKTGPTTLETPRPGAEERVALIAHALKKAEAQALLEGFAEPERERALAFLRQLQSQGSAERQGRMSFEFGIRVDASQRLRDVWNQAGPALRRALFAQLPPYHRTVFPDYVPPADQDAAADPGLEAFAERLIREATR